jgi:hypothetical protein
LLDSVLLRTSLRAMRAISSFSTVAMFGMGNSFEVVNGWIIFSTLSLAQVNGHYVVLLVLYRAGSTTGQNSALTEGVAIMPLGRSPC